VKYVQILMGFAALVCNVAVSGEIERTLDVGFGFKVVLEAEPTGPGAFESIAHYKYLLALLKSEWVMRPEVARFST
jgi:hypothetical protein